MIDVQLTKRQVETISYQCLGTKKHWSEKKQFCIGLIKSFYKEINEDNLGWFLETFVPSEEKRIKVKYFQDSQSGKLNTKFTPTDVAGTFEVADTPTVGRKYHLSWAFKAAVFVLVEIDKDGVHGYVDNPKYKRAFPMKIKLCDLRKLN